MQAILDNIIIRIMKEDDESGTLDGTIVACGDKTVYAKYGQFVSFIPHTSYRISRGEYDYCIGSEKDILIIYQLK